MGEGEVWASSSYSDGAQSIRDHLDSYQGGGIPCEFFELNGQFSCTFTSPDADYTVSAYGEMALLGELEGSPVAGFDVMVAPHFKMINNPHI